VTSATPLLDGLVSFLRDDGWPVQLVPGAAPAVETRCAGDSLEWACTGRAFEAEGQVVFDSALPVAVPEELAGPVALLLSCLNWDLPNGAFAIDTATGGVRLRTSLLVAGEPRRLTTAAVKALVYANVLTVDRCIEPLQEVAAGRLGLEQALERLAP